MLYHENLLSIYASSKFACYSWYSHYESPRVYRVGREQADWRAIIL